MAESAKKANIDDLNFKSIGPDTPMTFDIQTQEVLDLSIKYLDLKPVTNPINFERDGIPTVNGLFSDYIFGVTSEERRRQWAFIDLGTKIIHPFIYDILTKLKKNIGTCCSGEGVWKITSDGDLEPCKETDKEYNPNNTGMDWMIANLHKLKFRKNKSRERSERIDTLNTFSPDEYIIDKWLVQPVFYRDVEGSDGPKKIPAINKSYAKLISLAKSLKFDSNLTSNLAKFNIQQEVINIHKYFITYISESGSNGFFKDFVVGKNPDYGYRSVISCMILDQYDKPSEVPIDTITCGVPLAQVCVILFPFIQRWICNYLTDQFESVYNGKIMAIINGKAQEVELDNPLERFTPDYIKKKIDKWIDSYESRNDPIMVPLKNGEEAPIYFTGRPYDPIEEGLPGKELDNHQLAYRPFTWTDLIYIAACEVSEDKHIWTTRYPLVSYAGVFPCKIHVMSTIKTEPITINIYGVEKQFPFYPRIRENMSLEEISTSFNDTVNMDNSFLEAIGGDYDGDTVSLRSVFSVEANQETEDIIMSKKQYINAQGKIIRTIGNEAIFSLYSFTKTDKRAKPISQVQKSELLSLNWKTVGIQKITELVGTTTDMETKIIKDPKFNVYDKMTLAAGEYINKEAVDTTVGLFLFNKVCIEPYISKIIPNGYWNAPLYKDNIGKLFDIVSAALEYDKITTDELWPWLKAIQFYAYKGTTIFNSSLTDTSIMPDENVIAKRDKFFKEHPDASVTQVVELEEQLSKQMKEKISHDSSRTLFDSGAKAKVEDQLKNINTMIGPVYNPETGEFDIIKNSYLDGFSKEDVYKAGNMVVSASYPKAVGTADAGYITKQFYGAFGAISVDKEGTDCHTKSYLNIVMTEDNWRCYEGQNVMVGPDKHETITNENYKKFVGRTVKLRSPMCCISEKVCSVCVGTRPYMTGMTNIGTQFATVPNTFLNAGMKKFHTSKVKLDEVDEKTLFI